MWVRVIKYCLTHPALESHRPVECERRRAERRRKQCLEFAYKKKRKLESFPHVPLWLEAPPPFALPNVLPSGSPCFFQDQPEKYVSLKCYFIDSKAQQRANDCEWMEWTFTTISLFLPPKAWKGIPPPVIIVSSKAQRLNFNEWATDAFGFG